MNLEDKNLEDKNLEDKQKVVSAQVGPEGDGQLQSTAQTEAGEGEDLLFQLNAARTEAHKLEDRVLRLAAEFENYKKRIQRERETSLKYAEENLLKELLSPLDNLERSIEQGRNAIDASILLEGVKMTHNGLIGALEKFGLKAMNSRGAVFDPNYHEALVMEVSPEVPANTIISEFQRGYFYKDRLLRAAKVVVSSGRGDGASTDD